MQVTPGTIYIFQMDWKRYVIAFAKYLPRYGQKYTAAL